jgi:alpha-tubulin suppressor-like RCC1 family protein
MLSHVQFENEHEQSEFVQILRQFIPVDDVVFLIKRMVHFAENVVENLYWVGFHDRNGHLILNYADEQNRQDVYAETFFKVYNVEVVKQTTLSFMMQTFSGTAFPTFGGNNNFYARYLRGVRQIACTSSAFAALLNSGKVCAWGNSSNGGCTAGVENHLIDVFKIFSNDYSFAALLSNGRVVTWGNSLTGGRSLKNQPLLKKVKTIYNTKTSFSAWRDDGQIVSWGECEKDLWKFCDSKLCDIDCVITNEGAYVAIVGSERRAVAWGNKNCGGDIDNIQHKLTHVRKIVASSDSFVAILQESGVLLGWGNYLHSNPTSIIFNDMYWVARTAKNTFVHIENLQNVKEVVANRGAYAALLADDSVCTWGDSKYLTGIENVCESLHNVSKIYSNECAFAALMQNKTVLTWGMPMFGGDSSKVTNLLQDVVHVFPTETNFYAKKNNGRLVKWGTSSRSKKKARYVLT